MKRKNIKTYQKYTYHQMHELLREKLFSEEYKNGEYKKDIKKQACFCPYYVPLKGELGSDWGIIVNPQSPKFGYLVFEHDGCECPNHENQYGNQIGTSWVMRVRKKTKS